MATISQILPRHWPGALWTLSEDDYLTLEWLPGNALPKPSEIEIRAHSAAVDVTLSEEDLADRKDRLLFGRAELLKAIDILTAAVESAAPGSDPRLPALRTRIDEIKALT